MKKFNLNELVSQLKVDHKEFDMGDNIAVYFKGHLSPIKLNGIIREELKVFKGSFCIYYVYDEDKNPDDYKIDIEIFSLEEYTDSPNSIYIDETGFINADEYGRIHTIEIGSDIVFKAIDGFVTHYQFKDIK